MNGEVWKYMTAVLGSAVVTGVTSWMVMGGDLVRRGEMEVYVEKYSPYVLQRGELMSQLRQVSETSANNAKVLAALKDRIDALILENAKQTAALRKAQEDR